MSTQHQTRRSSRITVSATLSNQLYQLLHEAKEDPSPQDLYEVAVILSRMAMRKSELQILGRIIRESKAIGALVDAI